jgi:hypothetical protein
MTDDEIIICPFSFNTEDIIYCNNGIISYYPNGSKPMGKCRAWINEKSTFDSKFHGPITLHPQCHRMLNVVINI